MIWLRMCAKLGGEPQALKALKDGDIYAVTDMNRPDKKLYIMREYVDERKWESMREKSGEQAMATALDGITNHATCEALLGNLLGLPGAILALQGANLGPVVIYSGSPERKIALKFINIASKSLLS